MKKKHRIIVVNDDSVVQFDIGRILTTCGYVVNTFNDFDRAWDALASAQGDRLVLNLDLGRRDSGGSEGDLLLQIMIRHDVCIPTIGIAQRTPETIALYQAAYPFIKLILDPRDINLNIARIDDALIALPPLRESQLMPQKRESDSRKQAEVFIIHGRNEQHRKRLINILYSVGVQPVYLQGEPVTGAVVIEAIMDHVDRAEFAIAIFSADDIGYLSDKVREKKPRARQNVVLETGLFISGLGRNKVMVLYEDKVELPTDIVGIIYIPLSLSDEELKMRIIQTFQKLSIKTAVRV